VGELDALVGAAKAGDREAFARLVERDAPVAYRAALAVLRSPEDARDATQDATLRAWQRLSDLREPSSWPSWFRRIAVRSALDHARRGRRREQRLRPEPAADEPDPGPAADQRVTILAALASLSADDRAVSWLALRRGSRGSRHSRDPRNPPWDCQGTTAPSIASAPSRAQSRRRRR
jgi:RNA polymerase sigma factor (sigma-70 family)